MSPVLGTRLATLRHRLGEAETTFECCDTDFHLRATGPRAEAGVTTGRRRARALEARLNAFAPDSAVATLNETGAVVDDHVARVVERALEYRDRTGGAFDVGHGAFEHDLKAYLRGTAADRPDLSERDRADGPVVHVDGDRVEAAAPVDLNGLAKGYVVDRTREAVAGPGRTAFVSGGGDMTPPPGPVGVESPYGGEDPLVVLDTDWAIASSAGYRRERDGTDHLYDPRSGEIGGRHDVVTVLARRDCTEADALATTLQTLPVADALALVGEWPGAEALVVHGGVFHRSDGFQDHVTA